MFRKLELGDYRWMTYEEVLDLHTSIPALMTLHPRGPLHPCTLPQVDGMADSFGRGLRTLGQAPGQELCLFADTRMEWLVAAQASFRQSFPVVTIYTNLGEGAVVHGLAETRVQTLVTSHELLPRWGVVQWCNGAVV